MRSIKILWVDDEIELLKPHIMFLEEKKYSITPCQSGSDAIDVVQESAFDLVFLDENMPGLSGLETLEAIKNIHPDLPVVMVTKNEEEGIMEEAIGSKISDYLIKPVNPHQLLLSLKKNLDHNRLVAEKTNANYQQEFRKLALEMMEANSLVAWSKLYQKLIFWELELDKIGETDMLEILLGQKHEANAQFSRFVEKNYQEWIQDHCELTLSHKIFKEKVCPLLESRKPTLLLVIDNLRYDQWRVIEPEIRQFFSKTSEETVCSILPTATQYARNAIFSGLTPLEMEKQHPNLWKNDTDEGGKNMFEEEFLKAQIQRLNLDVKLQYHKITNLKSGKKLVETLQATQENELVVLVYNFVDMISHAKTEMEVIKELASTDKAYRSLTQSWFANSPLISILKRAQKEGFQLILTTDHGTINVNQPSKIIGDRESSLNIRYKTGKRLNYESKDVMAVEDPATIMLPKINFTSSYVFAKESFYLVYPTNYNHFVNFFKDTYQHGGISLEEMLIPFVVLQPK